MLVKGRINNFLLYAVFVFSSASVINLAYLKSGTQPGPILAIFNWFKTGMDELPNVSLKSDEYQRATIIVFIGLLLFFIAPGVLSFCSNIKSETVFRDSLVLKTDLLETGATSIAILIAVGLWWQLGLEFFFLEFLILFCGLFVILRLLNFRRLHEQRSMQLSWKLLGASCLSLFGVMSFLVLTLSYYSSEQSLDTVVVMIFTLILLMYESPYLLMSKLLSVGTAVFCLDCGFIFYNNM